MLRISEQLDDKGKPLDVILIDQLSVDCIVGVYPDERHTLQPLHIDLALHLDTREAARGSLNASIDYARLSGEIRFLLESCRFSLLESAADAIARYVLAPPTPDVARARPVAVDIRLQKPKALAGRGIPALQITRRADEMEYGVEHKPFGEVDIIFELPDCGIYRLKVAPGTTLPTHIHRVMEERELILGDQLRLQNQPVRAGQAFTWPKEWAHRYENPSAVAQTILCVDRPSFQPEDEIEVPEPPGGCLPISAEIYFR